MEDDPEIRELESYALKSSGYETVEFAEGSSFFNALHREKPDLVLLDVMLPGEDGLSILKHLRSQSDTMRLPVILVTARSTELDTVRGLDLGADDYIAKPFGIMELVSRVARQNPQSYPGYRPLCQRRHCAGYRQPLCHRGRSALRAYV